MNAHKAVLLFLSIVMLLPFAVRAAQTTEELAAEAKQLDAEDASEKKRIPKS